MRERHNPDEKRKDNDLWRDDISFIVVWGRDLALACAPFGAKSCIWPQCWSQSKSRCTQTERRFLYTPSPFVVSGHFVHGDLLLLPPDSSFFPTSKFFCMRPPVKPVNITLLRVVEGWICISAWSETQSGATFKACQNAGPPGKAHCPQIDPTPLVLFI